MHFTECIKASASDDDALAEIIRHFAADSGTVHRLGPDGNLHLATASRGMPEVVLEKIRTIPIGKGMAGLAVERRAPVDACNIQTDTSGDVRPGALATGMSGAIVVPMFRDGEIIGTLGIANRLERTFTAEEIEALLDAARCLGFRLSSPT